MKLDVAKSLINRLLMEYGLSGTGWTWKWGSSINYAGTCVWKTKTIYISKRYVKINNFRLVNWLIRHEMAHAFTGPVTAYHDNVIWKMACKHYKISPLAYLPKYTRFPRRKTR